MEIIRNSILLVATVFLLLEKQANAIVYIKSYKKNYSWKDEWSTTILEELKRDEFREGNEGMLNLKVDKSDLNELKCEGYNKASLDEKSDFWVVFFSALARAESAFNERARSPMTRGHRSFGLLQLANETAKARCGIMPPEKSVFNANDNLKCGIKLMSWQLRGAPKRNEKKLRPDLAGQLFGKYMFQWGPLRENDRSGRKLLVNWFKDHLEQLKFCH